MGDSSGQDLPLARLRQAGYQVACDLRPFGRWRAAACATGRPSAIAYGRTAAEALTLLCDTLEEVGLTPSIPKGAYYVLADSSRLSGKNSKEKAMSLLTSTGVAAVPGRAFFHDDSGDNLLRFCFAKTNNDLEAACERLQKLKAVAAVR